MIEYSFYGCLLSIVIWLYAYLRNKSQIQRNSSHGTSFFELGIITILFSTFAYISGDFYSYREIYDSVITVRESRHLEDFYVWLINHLPTNYFLWRAIVWGAATYLLLSTFKKLRCNPQFSSLLFILISLVGTFYFLRNSLGYCMLYYGVAVLLCRKNLTSALWGLLAIGISYFLHKSMFLYIGIMIIAFIPLNKSLIKLSIILFPIIYSTVFFVSTHILSFSGLTEQSGESGLNYLNSEDVSYNSNIFGYLKMFINRLPIYLLLIKAMKDIYFKKIKVEYRYLVFLQYSYFLTYLSFLFLGQEVSKFLSPRFWDASLLPLTIFLAHYLYIIPRTKYIRICLYLLLFSIFYNFSYQIYSFFK